MTIAAVLPTLVSTIFVVAFILAVVVGLRLRNRPSAIGSEPEYDLDRALASDQAAIARIIDISPGGVIGGTRVADLQLVVAPLTDDAYTTTVKVTYDSWLNTGIDVVVARLSLTQPDVQVVTRADEALSDRLMPPGGIPEHAPEWEHDPRTPSTSPPTQRRSVLKPAIVMSLLIAVGFGLLVFASPWESTDDTNDSSNKHEMVDESTSYPTSENLDEIFDRIMERTGPRITDVILADGFIAVMALDDSEPPVSTTYRYASGEITDTAADGIPHLDPAAAAFSMEDVDWSLIPSIVSDAMTAIGTGDQADITVIVSKHLPALTSGESAAIQIVVSVSGNQHSGTYISDVNGELISSF